MKKVALRFPSVPFIWEFISLTKPSYLHVRVCEKLVICTCSDDNISLAKNKFQAIIVNDETVQNN